MNSDKELKKAIDSIQPGSCFGHYETSARECKSCFVVEQCSKNTAGKKLEAEANAPSGKPKKKATTSVKKKYVKRKEDIKSAEVEKPKTEDPKSKEVPKVEAPKVESPKVEVPKVETPKVQEAPKAEVPCAVEGIDVKSTGVEFLDLVLTHVSKSIPVSGYFATDGKIFYVFDGKKMVITYIESSGRIQLSKDGEKKVYSKLKSEEDANILKSAMLVGYED